MKRIFLLLLLFVNSLIVFSQQSAENIRLNQIGFLPFAQKQAAVVNTVATNFQILDENKNIVYTGKLIETGTWAASGEKVKIADFSLVTTPGYYSLFIPKTGESFLFGISNSVFTDVNNAIVKAFYLNRASIELTPEFAGVYARPAGHADEIVYVLPSAAGPERKAGDVISASKGWYDAGDYNKYIVNSGITVGTLLLAYENYAQYFDTLTWNLPESKNNIPDLLDEIKWNLDWMLTMQDPADGGVYNKTTSAHFCGMVLPHLDDSKRYVVAKGTAASLDFAAVMAFAYRVYKPFDQEFAQTCLNAAIKAWGWALQNNNVPFYNPQQDGEYPKVTTGGYGDHTFDDERIWAASELLIATKDKQYAPYINLDYTFTNPVWCNVATLSLYSLYNHKDVVSSFISYEKVQNIILKNSSEIRSYQAYQNPYRVSASHFPWGSNGVIASESIMLLYGYKITGDLGYYNAALSNYDYILGRNATEYSFVTEYGEKSSRNIHHRPSEGDKIEGSVPGFLAGGPNGGNKRDCFGNYSRFSAKAYNDAVCSFTTNEIAINWQAPLVYLSHAVVAEYKMWKKSIPALFVTPYTSMVYCNYNDSIITLPILSNTNFKLSTKADWLGIDKNVLSNSSIIEIKILGNNFTDKNREAVIEFWSGNKLVNSITIIQYAKKTSFRLEAEDYDSMLGVQTENTSDSGGGLNIGWINNGDFLIYDVVVPQSGTYNAGFRVASYHTTGTFEMYIDNTLITTVVVPPTGGWQEWVTITEKLTLVEGKHTVEIKIPQGGFNLNYIDFELVK